MLEFIKNTLSVLHIGALILVFAWGLLGVIHEMIGPAKFENILYAINVSLSFATFCRIGYALVAVLIVTYFLKKRI